MRLLDFNERKDIKEALLEEAWIVDSFETKDELNNFFDSVSGRTFDLLLDLIRTRREYIRRYDSCEDFEVRDLLGDLEMYLQNDIMRYCKNPRLEDVLSYAIEWIYSLEM